MKNKEDLYAKRSFRIWKGVVSRGIGKCSHRHYFDRGIEVCDRWLDYYNFLEDVGEPLEGQSLDRIDVNKGYSPDNCRWACNRIQANNKTNTRYFFLKGERRPLSEIAFETGIPSGTILSRVSKKGVGIVKAISTPHEAKYQRDCRLRNMPHVSIFTILDYWCEREEGRIDHIDLGFYQLREFLMRDGIVQDYPHQFMKYKGIPIKRSAAINHARLFLKKGMFTTDNINDFKFGEWHKYWSRDLLPTSPKDLSIYSNVQ